MIAAPLPLLWRRIDAAAALNRVGARAIITSSRRSAQPIIAVSARTVAAEVFPIRYVCSFGENLPDGVIPLDDLLAAAPLLDPPAPVDAQGNPAAHVAVVTFEVTADGLMAVARNHMELIAGGAGRAPGGPTARMTQRSSLRAATARSRGWLRASLPWLLTGGTLSLHQPFDAATFAEQCRNDRCDTVVRAGPAGDAARAGGPADARGAENHPGAVARAGAAGRRFGLAAFAGRLDRCPGVRRNRADRCAPRPGRRARPKFRWATFRRRAAHPAPDQCSKPR